MAAAATATDAATRPRGSRAVARAPDVENGLPPPMPTASLSSSPLEEPLFVGEAAEEVAVIDVTKPSVILVLGAAVSITKLSSPVEVAVDGPSSASDPEFEPFLYCAVVVGVLVVLGSSVLETSLSVVFALAAVSQVTLELSADVLVVAAG